MEPKPLSASSISVYLQCLLKFYYRYYDKKPKIENTEALAFGTAVHAGLEHMYELLQNSSGSAPSPEVYDKVIHMFNSTAVSEGLDNLSLYEEGRDMLIKRLDNVSMQEKVIGLELDFNLVTENGTPFRGSIDKLLELDEETAVVIDYKTSRTALTQEEADKDIQLSMYDYAVSVLYPQYKTIVLALDYLRLGEVITHRTPEQRAAFANFLDTVYEQIKQLEPEDMKPKLNQYCSWCAYKTYCPAFKKAVTDPDLLIEPMGELDDDQFVEAWVNFQNVKKAVNGMEREMKDQAYQRMVHGTKSSLTGSGYELYKVQSSRINYNSNAVLEVVGPQRFAKMANVNKTAVEKFLRDNPQHKDYLEETAQYSYNAAHFRHRKAKKD